MEFRNLFANNNIKDDPQKYYSVFRKIKPLIVSELENTLEAMKISKTGRPRKVNLGNIVDAVMFISYSGSQMSFIKDLFKISIGTFYRYFKTIKEEKIIENLYYNLISQFPLEEDNILITDTTSIKSFYGSEGLGRSSTDRGRKGLKISILSDRHYISRGIDLRPSNNHDCKIFKGILDQMEIYPQRTLCLCDSGYIGKEIFRKR